MHARGLFGGDRASIAFFAVLELAAVPCLLWFGRGGWFIFDEWDLLAQRTGGDLGDLFRPHYQHWFTLPILAYRLCWQLFGMRTYVPYQLLSIVVHLAAVALLLVVMRRAGVAPWIAAVFSGVFVFFGSGVNNILLGFLISFVGSLVFGLVHLLLADHDGPVDRRDWFGLLAGFAGMLCSGVAVSMVMVVGLAVLIRRGWRIAVLHTAPLGGIYLLWLAIIGRRQNQHLPLERPTASEVVRFVAVGVRAAFAGLGEVPGVGLVLALVLLAGLSLAFMQAGRDEFRRRAAAPIALLGGAIFFLTIAGTGRAGHFTVPLGVSGPEYAREGRYVHLVAAMLLPALALAADAMLRRWRAVGAVVLVLPLLGVPGNVQKFFDFRRDYKALDSVRERILLAPRVPLAAELPRSIAPEGFYAPGLTLGWLIDGIDSGRVPLPRSREPAEVATETLRLALVRLKSRPAASCAPETNPLVRVFNKGQSITLKTASATVVYLPPASAPSRPITYRRIEPSPSLTLLALAGPLRLRISTDSAVMSCE
jgi:hypothetical protein